MTTEPPDDDCRSRQPGSTGQQAPPGWIDAPTNHFFSSLLGIICGIISGIIGYGLFVTSPPLYRHIWAYRGLRYRIMVIITAGIITGLLGAGIAWLLTSQAEKRIAKAPAQPVADNWSIDGAALIKEVGASRATKIASVTVDMAVLSRFAKDYSFYVILRVADHSVEALTDTRIEKSQAFTITNEVRTVQVNLSDDFIARADAADRRFNQVSLQFYFALLPKHIRPEQILTLSDIPVLGGQRLLSTPPPEFISQPHPTPPSPPSVADP